MKLSRYHVIAVLLWILGLIFLGISRLPSDEIEPFFMLSSVLLGMPLLGVSGFLFVISLIMAPTALLLSFFEKGNKRHYQVNTKPFPELDEETQVWEDELLANGFRYLGMYEGVLRGKQAGSKAPAIYPDYMESAVYIEESLTIYAEIIRMSDGKRFAAIISDYPDGFSYQTNYQHPQPIGEDTQWIVIDNVKSSLSTAYDYHAAQAEKYTALHGKPKKISKVEDALTSDEVKDAQIRAINLSNFQRFGIAALLFFPVAVAAYYLNFSFEVLNAPARMAGVCGLMGLLCFFGDTIQTKLLMNKAADERKQRKVAE